MMVDDGIWKPALNAIDLPIFIVDANLTVVYANPAVKSMTKGQGFVDAAAESEGKNLFDLMPVLSESVGERYKALFETGEPQEDEIVYPVRGGLSCIQSRRYPVFSGGRVSHAVVMLQDITEFRGAQEALKHSEETALAIINASSESLLLSDAHGTILALNDVAARRLGKPKADILGKQGQEILPLDVWKRREPHNRELLRTKQKVSYRDVRDGIVFDTTMYPILDNAGNVRQVAIFATDITQSVAAQEEMIRIRQAVESSSDAIAMADISGKHIFSNKAFESLLGYSVGQLNDAGGASAAYRDPAMAAEVFETLKSGKPWSGVANMIARDGRELIVDIRADAIRDDEGKLIGLVGIHTDVTTQRQAAEQLRRSEERFRLQFNSIPVPTFIWESDGEDFVLREYNLCAETLTSGGVVQSIGRRATEMYTNWPDIIRDLKECHARKTVVFREMTYQYEFSPSERFLSVHYVPIPPNLIMVHTIDMTERKRVESELQAVQVELERKVQERTEALRKQIDFDSLVRRLLTSFASCREEEIDSQVRRGLRELAEFAETDSAHTVLVSADQTTYRVAHSWVRDEWPDYSNMYQNVSFGANPWLEKKVLAAEEIVIRTLDDFPNEAGQERQAYEREGVKSAVMVPIRGRGGSVQGVIGFRSYAHAMDWRDEHVRWLRTVGDAVANVLERKQAELARRDEQDKAELYLQTAEVMLVALASDGTVTRINRKGRQILGYEEHELIGRNWLDVCVPEEERERVGRVVRGLYSGSAVKYETFENAVVTKSGAVRVIAWRHSLLHSKSGAIIGILSSGEDVTDRRRAEKDLDRAYKQLQVEQLALHQKNIALQEMVEQIQESKRITAAQIQSNLERMVLPVLERIGPRLDPQGQQYMALVRTGLADILSPFVSDLENQFKRLSPREVEICELIRRGYDTKQIAELRSSSVQTVLKQRKAIRKKLGLDRKKINLATYLTSTFPAQRKREKGKNII